MDTYLLKQKNESVIKLLLFEKGKKMSFIITGTGRYVPGRTVTNDELSEIVDTNDEWIKTRVGVERRHVAVNETTAEMAYEAALAALDNSGCTAKDLDLILVSTVSGDCVSPSTACMVQKMLGATCMAYDINAACSAFLFLLETAAGYFARGWQRVLVIGAERMSRIVDWSDRSTCVIFGDGAGAAVLERGDGYSHSVFHVDGGDNVIKIPHYNGKSPYYQNSPEEPYIMMKGQETFKYAVHSITRDIEEVEKLAGISHDALKYIVPHQANSRIIDAAARKLGIPYEKFYVNIAEYGNTSSASIPIALDELNRGGMLQKDDLLLLTAFGGGLASAACLIKWSK